MSGYPRLRVEGGPRERGRQYGEQARERIRRSVDSYRELFARVSGLSWPEATARARSFEVAIAGYGEAYLAELRGIANGAGLTFGDVLALNIRTEVLGAARAGTG